MRIYRLPLLWSDSSFSRRSLASVLLPLPMSGNLIDQCCAIDTDGSLEFEPKISEALSQSSIPVQEAFYKRTDYRLFTLFCHTREAM